MEYFRNPEIKKEIGVVFVMTVIVITGATFCLGVKGGIIACFVAILYSGFHFTTSILRYRKLQNLTEQLDSFLHGYENVTIIEEKEGELSILRSEISKLIIRLKNQAAKLMDERKYLADSIADISHQVRTPLTSVNLLVSRLSVESLSKEKRFEIICELEERLVQIDWLIQTLLRISKLDADTVKMGHTQVSVADLIKKSTMPLEISLELRGVQLIIDCEDSVRFSGDLSWSVEALSNVIKNCMEHTKEGGYVRVSAQENALYTEILVEDNGTGIDRGDLPHLFERFYKGKNSSDQSVGIGLALSRMIWKRQNGTIEAKNRKEGGACFEIRIYKVTI